MLDAVRQRKAEVAVDVGAHLVGIEDDAVEQRRQTMRERGFASARQAPDQDLLSHWPTTFSRNRSIAPERRLAWPAPMRDTENLRHRRRPENLNVFRAA